MQFIMLVSNCSVNNKCNFKKGCQIHPGICGGIISGYIVSSS